MIEQEMAKKWFLRDLSRFLLFLLSVSIFLVVLLSGIQITSSDDQIPVAVKILRASWYGPGFHGRKTASGEVYDMYKISAAHKLLPMGTEILLINPQNGIRVSAVINDRGQYVSGRDIDISLAAAEALGIRDQGVADLLAIIKQ